MGKIILSFCDYTGAWSQPYRDAGYDVRQFDLKLGTGDLRLMHMIEEPVHGILAAPDCTKFALSGNRWKRTEAEMTTALSLVDACLRFVAVLKPEFWALENPVGKLRHYLGPAQLIFNPCDYGDPYTKRTCLWGSFNTPATNPVEPTEGSKMWRQYGGRSARTKELRSITPAGFARAFFEANR